MHVINSYIYFHCISAQGFKAADIAKSLLIGISNDIGQIAYLNAKMHGLRKIYFGGYFIRGHPMTMHTITYAINYWSKVCVLGNTLSKIYFGEYSIQGHPMTIHTIT